VSLNLNFNHTFNFSFEPPRIAQPSDWRAVRAFLERLSPASVQSRYLSAWTALSGAAAERETRRLLDRDPDRHVVLLVTDGHDVRGIGEYVVEAPERAEFALMVEDAYQQRGIGRHLLLRLEELATRRGITTFSADVASSNLRMQRLLRGLGRPLHTQLGAGQLRFTMRLDATPNPARLDAGAHQMRLNAALQQLPRAS
jgi:GNAT superfamily N-acetyltransferase